jgi:hypothetical protein
MALFIVAEGVSQTGGTCLDYNEGLSLGTEACTAVVDAPRRGLCCAPASLPSRSKISARSSRFREAQSVDAEAQHWTHLASRAPFREGGCLHLIAST